MIRQEAKRENPGADTKRFPLILGFDPGTQVTGWGAIRTGRRTVMAGCGAIRSPREVSLAKRLEVIYREACNLIEEFRPEIIAVEDPFVGCNVASAMKLGHARGVLLLAAVQAGVEPVHYSPREVKSSIVGTGSAAKEQVQFMVQKLLGLREPPKPLDASDALAVALCHFNRHKLSNLGRR